MRKSVMTVLAVLAAAAGFGAITGSITTDQGEQKGTIRWSARDKAYAVKGKNGIEVQVKPSDVVEMSINKPDGYDEAVEQVAKGQGAAAIPTLQKIVKDYAHLDWDKAAGRYLAEALIVSGKAADGLRVCEDIIKNDETAAYKGDLAPSYWEALLVLDRRPKLESSLRKAAKSGDPFSVGAALIKRRSKKGTKKVFYGCERYPDCDFVSWDKPTNIRCEKCGGMMVQKIGRNGSYVICMDKDCGHILRNTKKAKEEDA